MAYGFSREMEPQIQAASCGRPFTKCSCGASIPASFGQCAECARLSKIGFGPAAPKNPVVDTQEAQSYPSDKDHSGYSDTISSKKFPSGKERV